MKQEVPERLREVEVLFELVFIIALWDWHVGGIFVFYIHQLAAGLREHCSQKEKIICETVRSLHVYQRSRDGL